MDQESIRRALIDSTIHIIANNGLDKATTKHIANRAGVNEVYIYRAFDGKDDLYMKTFLQLDQELVAAILRHIPIMDMTNIKIEDRCWALFSAVWKFVLGNEEKTLSFIRYYYSPYFKKYSCTAHREAYRVVVEKFRPAFKADADVWMLLCHILDVLLAAAVKVYNGELPDNDRTAAYVFDLLYSSVESKLTWSKQRIAM